MSSPSETQVDIPSTEGMLSAVIHKPEGETSKLAVLCPGYLDSKDYKNIIGLADALAEKGYTVVRFDPTGTWESDGDLSKYTVSQCIEDVRNIINYMFRQKELLEQSQYDHVLVGGHSRGATVSVLYAARDSRVSTVLAIMPKAGRETENLHKYVEWEKTNDRTSYRDLPEDNTKQKEFHVPFSFAIDADRYDVVKDVKKIKAGIVLVAGELDDICTPASIEKIYNNAYWPKEFVTMSGIDHDYRQRDDEIKIVDEKALSLVSNLERTKNHSV